MGARVIQLTQYVSATDVQSALGCSRSQAYYHLRAAAGRTDGTRSALRVAVHVWERYAKRLAVSARKLERSELAPSTGDSASAPVTKGQRSRYKMTEAQAAAMLAQQGGACAICERAIAFDGRGSERAVFDHDHHAEEEHAVMHVRGILCYACNTGEGAYGSSVERHLRGALYLLRTSYRAPAAGRARDLLGEIAAELGAQ